MEAGVHCCRIVVRDLWSAHRSELKFQPVRDLRYDGILHHQFGVEFELHSCNLHKDGPVIEIEDFASTLAVTF